MIALIQFLLLIFWVLDITNMPFMEMFDTTYPMNEVFWLLIWIFVLGFEVKTKKNDGGLSMSRLTISKITEETGTYELAHNCTFIRDGETWYRDFDNEIRLRDMMREIIKNHSQYDEQYDDDEILDGILFENLQYPADDIDGLIAVFNVLAWSHSDLRERLKKYEDTGLSPEQVQELKERGTAKRPDYEGDGYDNEGNLIYDTWICPN